MGSGATDVVWWCTILSASWYPIPESNAQSESVRNMASSTRSVQDQKAQTAVGSTLMMHADPLGALVKCGVDLLPHASRTRLTAVQCVGRCKGSSGLFMDTSLCTCASHRLLRIQRNAYNFHRACAPSSSSTKSRRYKYL